MGGKISVELWTNNQQRCPWMFNDQCCSNNVAPGSEKQFHCLAEVSGFKVLAGHFDYHVDVIRSYKGNRGTVHSNLKLIWWNCEAELTGTPQAVLTERLVFYFTYRKMEN